MLMLVIQVGSELYAIDSRAITEILPAITWRRLPKAPAGIAGVINYHGTPVPVLDLAQFIAQRASEQLMRTRIVVIDYQSDSRGSHPLGIIVERAIETLRFDEADFVCSGVTMPGNAHFGPVVITDKGIIQKLELPEVFPSDVRKHLFSALEADLANTD
jgi:chemotaxis-related protein WspB